MLRIAQREESVRQRGRPRSADGVILEAATAALAESGYEALTFQGVAERAGVARSTLYRRWPTKVDLAVDVATAIIDRLAPHDFGDASIDLENALDMVVKTVNEGADGRCMAALAGASLYNDELAKRWTERLDDRRRGHIRTVLQRGVVQGDVRPDVDMETTVDLLLSVVPYRIMFSGRRMTSGYGKRVVSAVMSGAAMKSGASP